MIKTLNPSFRFEKQKTGLLFSLLEPLDQFAENCSASTNPLKRHVVNRLTYLLLAIASIVIKVVDTIIGILAFTLSLLALGRWKQINNFAINTLLSQGFTVFFMGLAMVVKGTKN